MRHVVCIHVAFILIWLTNDIGSLHTFTLILLTLYHAPNLEQVAPPDAILPTIRKGRSLIATWADNPVVALYLSQIDDLMEQKDIDPERGWIHELGYP